MRAHVLARLLLRMPDMPIRFTDGTGALLRNDPRGPYLEDDRRKVWVDLVPSCKDEFKRVKNGRR